MNETTDLKDLFGALTTAADDSGLEWVPSEVKTEQQDQITFLDKLVLSCLDGVLPTVCLALVAYIASGFAGKPVVLGGTVLMSILMGWFFAPLSRNDSGASPRRLLALGLPVWLCAMITELVPEMMTLGVEGNPIHLELLAVSFQRNLEQALSLGSMVLFSGVWLLLAGSVFWLRRSHPWLDGTPRQRRVQLPRVVLLAALVAIVGVGMLWGPNLNSEEKTWRQEMKVVYESRPFHNLPATSEDTYWSDRLTGWRDSYKAKLGDRKVTFTPVQGGLKRLDNNLSEEEFDELARQQDVDLDFEAHPITSRAELEAAQDYLFGIAGRHPREVDIAFSKFELHVKDRPANVWTFIEERMADRILPRLVKESVTLAQCERWLKRVRELAQATPDRLREADLVAYRRLWGEPDKSHISEQTKWSWQHHLRGEELPIGNMTDYLANPQPTDLKAFGRTWHWSPTRLLALYQRTQLTREWVQMRKSELEQTTLVRRLESEPLARSARGEFWFDLLRRDRATEELRWYQTAEVVLAIRHYELTTGRLPKSLAEIATSIELSEDLQNRYRLESDPSSCQLTDQVLDAAFQLKGSR